MATLNDLKLSALRAITGIPDGHTADLEVIALKMKGAIGEQVNDLWMNYLTSLTKLPQVRGQLNQMQYDWLGQLGYYGNLNQRWMQFWANNWNTNNTVDDFKNLNSAGWICTRGSQALSVNLLNATGIFSANQIRFLGGWGLYIESARINSVPDTISYATWTQTGGAITTAAASICTNQVAAKFTCTVSAIAELHTMYTNVVPVTSEVVGFYLKFDSRKPQIRFEYRNLIFILNSDGTSSHPDLISSASFTDGWIYWTVDVSAGTTDQLMAFYLLSDGIVSWVADQTYTMEVFGVMDAQLPFAKSYLSTSVAGDQITKAPFVGFDGNDFQLVISFRPEFTSVQGAVLGGEQVIFEWGVAGVDQVKVYYNMATKQMIFDRYAQGLASFTIANGILEFGAFENIIVTVRQTAADGISIEAKGFVGLNNNANAKLASNMPTGDMYLGSNVSGSQQFNGAVEFIEFYSPAPLTSRQIV